ncbi:hypothetical protein Lal_00036652 [Lupinus albus]|uniref:Putative glucan endo-1,3-beta-D-glucosidase n=1 Tax=Lupinus albus TaxID=3870 RepID=A0A6A5NT20_LUPAL|nr:putative glucan endo-1,3-beta-D-glucosidase [Lupinus albus]KAF1888939.1 hypothetical protein Lal_00036652 [Lupinus albus]
MDSGSRILRINVAILYIVLLASTTQFPMSEAINHGRALDEGQRISRSTFIKSWKNLKSLNHLNKYSNFASYGSPSSLPLPPFNSLAPQPTPKTSNPASIYPPYPSLTPTPTPTYSLVPNPPHNNLGPPSSYVHVSPPPSYGNSSPPKHTLSPPKYTLSPPQLYSPPPPPSSPPPTNHKRPQNAVWCVAKPTVPDPIVQEAMDYACGCGADCKLIQPNGLCYQPNTLLAHASYAFNSYWQKTKFGGGTCDFGGTAMLITVDPSYNKCNYTLA